jgi:hypothetical protein
VKQVTTLLTTGAEENGDKLAPPMPAYHLSPAGASAIVAYLKSLKPPGK